MKKILLCILGLTITFTLVGCGKKEGYDESKRVASNIYEKANDTTITKCIIEYKQETKGVIYGFCINEAKTLYYTTTTSGPVGSVKQEVTGYNSMYSIYSSIEKEVNTPVDGYTAFEFKVSELK